MLNAPIRTASLLQSRDLTHPSRMSASRCAAVLACSLLACSLYTSPDTVRGPDPNASLNVLFIGNSLTYANDLPGLLHALGESTGVHISAQSVAKGGYALEDHWLDGEALRAIALPGWDIVILQQGPSALDASRTNLLQWADSFAVRIRAAGAEPAFYQVWTERTRPGDFDRSLESYALAAQHVNGLLLPAGGTWKAAWRRDSTLALYGTDGFHPSALGSYACAVAIFAGLTGRSAVGLPAVLTAAASSVSVPRATARLIQDAADEVLP